MAHQAAQVVLTADGAGAGAAFQASTVVQTAHKAPGSFHVGDADLHVEVFHRAGYIPEQTAVAVIARGNGDPPDGVPLSVKAAPEGLVAAAPRPQGDPLAVVGEIQIVCQRIIPAQIQGHVCQFLRRGDGVGGRHQGGLRFRKDRRRRLFGSPARLCAFPRRFRERLCGGSFLLRRGRGLLRRRQRTAADRKQQAGGHHDRQNPLLHQRFSFHSALCLIYVFAY